MATYLMAIVQYQRLPPPGSFLQHTLPLGCGDDFNRWSDDQRRPRRPQCPANRSSSQNGKAVQNPKSTEDND